MEELNVSGLEAKEVVQYLKEMYFLKVRQAILLVGDRGIGKSQSVRDASEIIAKELGREFIDYDDSLADKILENPDKYFVFVDFRMTEAEPSDLIGIPRPENGHVVYKPLKWAVVLSKVPGVLFLDEINMVQRPDVESVMFKILNDGKVGFVKLLGWCDKQEGVPEANKDLWVMIVSAGNDPKVNKLARYFTVPAMGRLARIDVKSPSVENWIEWMDSKFDDWDRRVALFLLRNRHLFYVQVNESRTLNVYPEPRKWTKVALGSHKLKGEMLRIFVSSLVGVEAAESFLTFISIKVPDSKDLLANPEIFASLKIDAQRLVLASLASEFSIDRVDDYYKFVKFLNDNDRESLVLFLMLIPRKYLKQWAKICLKYDKWSFILKTMINVEKIAYEINQLIGGS